jgi:hypothetical protein
MFNIIFVKNTVYFHEHYFTPKILYYAVLTKNYQDHTLGNMLQNSNHSLKLSNGGRISCKYRAINILKAVS